MTTATATATPTAAKAPKAPTSKHCPGARVASIQLTPPHEALLLSFNLNKSNADGLARVCKPCRKVATRARYEAAKAANPAAAEQAMADSLSEQAEPKRSRAATSGRVERKATDVATDVAYADELAQRAAAGKAKGYTTTQVGGVTYALPEGNGAVGSPEGQAALDALNTAKTAERKRLDRERKAAERARKKASEEAARA